MNSTQKFFVTGATGFVGSRLTANLLLEGHDVIVLARDNRSGTALQRMINVLTYWMGPSADLSKLVVLTGDVTERNLGLTVGDMAMLNGVDQIVHSAGLTAFFSDKCDLVNRVGTHNVLEVARLLNNGVVFNYVSTSYVAGDFDGDVFTADSDFGPARNPYEKSKQEAELLVRASGLYYRILRPSIVTGDLDSGRYIEAFGYLGYFSGFAKLKHMIATQKFDASLHKPRFEGSILVFDEPVRIRYEANGYIHLIPVDVLVDHQMVPIMMETDTVGGTFNCASEQPPEYHDLVERTLHVMGIQGVQFVDHEFVPSPLERMVAKAIAPYDVYVRCQYAYDTSNSNAANGGSNPCPPVTDDVIRIWISYAAARRFAGFEQFWPHEPTPDQTSERTGTDG